MNKADDPRVAKWRAVLEKYADRDDHDDSSYRQQLAKRVIPVEYQGREAVVAFGNRYSHRSEIFILYEDGRTEIVGRSRVKYLVYKDTGIYWPPGVFMGRTSLMGSISHGIKSGRVFRGR